MNFEVGNGIVKMQGFDIGGQILISDADYISLKDSNGKHIDAKEIEVVIEIDTLKDWINEWGLLDDIGINVW